VGFNSGSNGRITTCYAAGSVAGVADVGGLAGQNTGTIESSYARGAVSSSGTGSGTTPGGLVGWNNGGSVTNGNFDMQTTGTTNGVGDGGGGGITGRTTAQMTAINALTTMPGLGAGMSKRPDSLFYTYYPEITALYGGSGTQRAASEVSARGPERGPLYRIGHSVTGTHTFPSAVSGYGDQAPLTVTVSNLGNRSTGALTVEISGRQAASFSLSVGILSDIGVESADTFTVTPNRGRAPGTYTATVTIRGENGLLESFNVRFTVTGKPASESDSGSQASGHGGGAADADTAAGNMKTGDDSPRGFLWAAMIMSSVCLAGALLMLRRLFMF